MFNLFKSKKQKLLESAELKVAHFNPVLMSIDAPMTGQLLDLAAQIAAGSTQGLSDSHPRVMAFGEPFMLKERFALDYLLEWNKDISVLAESDEDSERFAAVNVWWLSLAGAVFPEIRINAEEMWRRLEVGFPFCEIFIPEKMAPKGYLQEIYHEHNEDDDEAFYLNKLNKVLESDAYNWRKFPEQLKKDIIAFEIAQAKMFNFSNPDSRAIKSAVIKSLSDYDQNTRLYLYGTRLSAMRVPIEAEYTYEGLYDKYDLSTLRK